MERLTQEEVDDRIKLHERWLKNGEIGYRPSFAHLDLSYMEFKRANLYHANFERSNLTGCNFRYANLNKAELKGANLTKAILKETNLFHANLHEAVLKEVKVNEYTMFYFPICPEEGEIIGYKKVDASHRQYAIVKLLIPADARRNSATTYRCRADKAKVLQIKREDNTMLNKAYSNYQSDFIYEVGKWLEIADFDEDRWHETAPGIHFYLAENLAKCY